MATVRFLKMSSGGQISTTAGENLFLKDVVVLNTQAGDYGFSEEATPLAPGDSSGATSQFTVRAMVQPRTDLALDQLLEIQLDNGEKFLGIVRSIRFGIASDIVTFTLDALLNLFNVNVDLHPIYNVPFSTAVIMWAQAVRIDSALIYVDPRIATQLVTWPGSTSINLWDVIKQMCAAYGYEAYSTGSKIGFRLPGEIELFLWEPNTTEYSIERLQREDKVTLKVYNSTPINGQVAYIADQVFEVEAGAVTETSVTVEGSLTSVLNPAVVSQINFNATIGQYVVTGSDGYIIDPVLWQDYGGKIEAAIGENYNEIKLTMTGAALPSRSPFRISEGVDDRPALRIAGTGLLHKPEDLTLLTGDEKASAVSVPPVVDNMFITGETQAWDRGIHTAQYFGNPEMTLVFQGTPNIRLVRRIPGQPEEELTSWFGHFAGAIARYRDAMYRVTAVSYSPDGMEVTMVEYTTIDDFNEVWADKTFGDFEDAIGPNLEFAQHGIRPLTAGGV